MRVKWTFPQYFLDLILNGRGFKAALPLMNNLSPSRAACSLRPAHPDGGQLSHILETEVILLTISIVL